ncbi:hypothetical protein C8F04DRAFT_164843 [Mycena alexandri]|uniref:F-box domain-containing protein n=1 Tax=Mycena alexandri TaxID=1745969 RepID=A0AAD6SF72_9AGAR|nr:hypothetical protein C8F04DRAFT_164843 [Mycena alexandri]
MSTPLPSGMRLESTNTETHGQVKGLIEATKTKIARLTVQIRELEFLRERERDVLAALRLMIVPIGQLPTELISEIFKLAVHTAVLKTATREGIWPVSSTMYASTRAALHKALCLSQVCGHWRRVAFSTRQLWAEGVVDIHFNKGMTDPYLDGFKSLLTRSTPYPLSVSLVGSDTAAVDSLRRIADIIVPTAYRWRNLRINMESFRHFNDISLGTFEALERLYIYDFSEQTSPVTAFQSCPRLREFTLKSGEESKMYLIQVPWQNLTHLNIYDESLGGCRTALLQCSNLTSATIATSYDWDFAPGGVDSPIIVLPFLETLKLTFYGFVEGDIDGIAAFFMPLSLPSLKSIDLEFNPNEDETWPRAVFSEFQNRSPKLQEIALLFSSIDASGLIALLRHGPSLQTLDIQNSWSCVGEDFFEALYYDQADSAPLAPKLENIHLESVGDDFEEIYLEDAIRSRWWKDGERLLPDNSPPRVSRLKRVWVAGRFSDELKARMKELVPQGLDLYLA